MTAPLELQYRRLLAVYPAAHRHSYEEEMVAVLMEGAQPGQRRPGLAEAADLLWSGFRAQLGRGLQAERGAGWRDAAVVVGFVGAVVLAAIAGRRLLAGLLLAPAWGISAFGFEGGLYLDVAVRSAAWLAVAIAVAAGLRRTAVALAVVGLLVEVGAIVMWMPRNEFRVIDMSWALATALLTVALLAFARSGRSARAVLGWRGMALVAGAGVLAVAALGSITNYSEPSFLGLNAPFVLSVAAAAMLSAALWAVRGGSRRRRALALLVPLFSMPIAQQMMEEAIHIYQAPTVTPGIVAVQVFYMIGVPLVAFAFAAATLHFREHFTVSLSVTRA
jgi:plasmid stability protein